MIFNSETPLILKKIKSSFLKFIFLISKKEMYSLDIEQINDFAYVKNVKKISCDLLMSVYQGDYPNVEEKHLRQIVNKLLTKEYNELFNEIAENQINQDEVNECLRCYQEDFSNDLKNAIDEFNKCVLNKVGNMKLVISGETVAKLKHEQIENNGFKVHRFHVGLD